VAWHFRGTRPREAERPHRDRKTIRLQRGEALLGKVEALKGGLFIIEDVYYLVPE
jgi:hypothetical protein